MTTLALREHTVTVAGKPMFVAEAGFGPPVVILRGGGPGASGVSNYSRNIDALADHFRVLVPDMPGYGRSAKGVDQSDPFGYLAEMIRGLLDELGIDTAHLVGKPPPGNCSRPGWRPIPESTPALAPLSSGPTLWHCSPGSALRHNPFRSHRRKGSVMSSAGLSSAASPA